MTDEEPAAPAGEERPEAGPAPGPVPLGSGALRSMVAEARMIATEGTPPSADDRP